MIIALKNKSLGPQYSLRPIILSGKSFTVDPANFSINIPDSDPIALKIRKSLNKDFWIVSKDVPEKVINDDKEEEKERVGDTVFDAELGETVVQEPIPNPLNDEVVKALQEDNGDPEVDEKDDRITENEAEKIKNTKNEVPEPTVLPDDGNADKASSDYVDDKGEVVQEPIPNPLNDEEVEVETKQVPDAPQGGRVRGRGRRSR